MWYVYILECRNKTLYTGITNDLARRLKAHREGKGAKFTRSFRVKKLVYSEKRRTRSAAAKREAEIKGWPRERKIALIKEARGHKV